MMTSLFKSSLVLSLVASSAAFAASTTTTVPTSAGPTSNVTVAETEDVKAPKKKLPVGFYVDNYFYGSTFEAPGKAITSGDCKNCTDGINSEHIFSLPVTLNEKTTISGNFHMLYRYNDLNGAKAGYSTDKAFLRLAQRNVLTANIGGNDFSLGGDVRYYAPTVDLLRERGSRGDVRFSLNPSLRIAKSKFTLSAANYIRYYIETNSDQANLRKWKLYTGPQVGYEATNKIKAFVLVEAVEKWSSKSHWAGDEENTSLVDIEPGITFIVNDNIELTPYLNLFTNQPLRTTSFNLNAVITLL